MWIHIDCNAEPDPGLHLLPYGSGCGSSKKLPEYKKNSYLQSELEILVTNFVLYTVVFTVWFEEININFKYTVPNFLNFFLHVLTALLFSGAHVTWRTAAWASSGKEKTPGLEFITRGFLNYHFETEEFFCWTDHKLYLKFILLLGMEIQICWTTINPIPPLLWEYARHWEIVSIWCWTHVAEALTCCWLSQNLHVVAQLWY